MSNPKYLLLEITLLCQCEEMAPPFMLLPSCALADGDAIVGFLFFSVKQSQFVAPPVNILLAVLHWRLYGAECTSPLHDR